VLVPRKGGSISPHCSPLLLADRKDAKQKDFAAVGFKARLSTTTESQIAEDGALSLMSSGDAPSALLLERV